jgi:hypothetical protein
MSTQPKRPQIAAKLRGPGPGRYGLPSSVGYQQHDPTKSRKPAFLFGQRFGDSLVGKSRSPGPVYAVDSRCTRNGNSGTPHYSILGRFKDLPEFKTPGPGSYSPEKTHPQGERNSPRFSMASRTRYRKSDHYPASNAYALPSLIGSGLPNKNSAAAYSMSSRKNTGRFDEDLSKTPGPARYKSTDPASYNNRSSGPQHSMLARRYLPSDKTQKPGPGAHNPEKVKMHMKKTPAFSMSGRHSEYTVPLIIRDD